MGPVVRVWVQSWLPILLAIALVVVLAFRSIAGAGLVAALLLYLAPVRRPLTDYSPGPPRTLAVCVDAFRPTLLGLGAFAALVYAYAGRPDGAGPTAGIAWACLWGSGALNLRRLGREPTRFTLGAAAVRVALWAVIAVTCSRLHAGYTQEARARADRIIAALDAYKARTGAYPASLDVLDPRLDRSRWRPGDRYPPFGYQAKSDQGLPRLEYHGIDGGMDFCDYRFQVRRWQCGIN